MADVRTPTSLQDQTSLLSPVRADTLPSEAVFDALKMILLDAPLDEILTSVTRLIESQSEGMLCSIFLVEEDGLHLRYAGTPNLPEAYRAATDGVCIGPNVGSCGTAAYLRQPVFVPDIASDPRWARFRGIALPNGLRAAWSSPIMSHDGKVLGTFCSYYREVRRPGPSDIQLIDSASRIAAVAIERDRSQTALTTAFEKIKKAEAEYRQIVDAIPQAIHSPVSGVEVYEDKSRPGAPVNSGVPSPVPIMKIKIAGMDGNPVEYEFQAGDIIQTKATFDKNGRANSNRFFVLYPVMLRDKADNVIFDNNTSDTFSQLINVEDRFIDLKIPLQSVGIDNARVPQIRIEEANSFAKVLPYQVGHFQPQ